MAGKHTMSAKEFAVTTTQEEEATSVEGSDYRDKENKSSSHRDGTTRIAAKLDADASILDQDTPEASPLNQNQPNRKVLSALSMFNAKINAKAATAAANDHDEGGVPVETSWKSAPEESEASSASVAHNSVAVVQRPRGKQIPQHMHFGKFVRQPVVSPTPQLPMLLNTQGPLRVSTRTPQRRDILSPVAATPRDRGTTKFKSNVTTDSSTRSRQRNATSRTTPFLLGKLHCENPFASDSSSTRRSTTKKKAIPETTLKITTTEPMKFPEILDAMLAEATFRKSKAIFWTYDGQSFGIDNTNHEAELAKLLQTYFNHSKHSSLQRQLNIYGWKKSISGPFKGTYFNPNFHRDKSKSTDLSPIRRNVSPRPGTGMTTRNSPKKRHSPPSLANPSNFTSLESLTETPAQSTMMGRRLKLKISTKRNALVSMPLVRGGTTTKRGRSKKSKTKSGATKRGKGSVHFDASAIVTAQFSNRDAGPVKHRTVTPAFSCLESPEVEVESDLQRVAHSIYNGESRDSLDCILGSACFEFCEMPDLAPSSLLEAPTMTRVPSKSLAFQHPAVRIANTKTTYAHQHQYDYTYGHGHSQIDTNTAPIAPGNEDPFAAQRVEARIGPQPASVGFCQTINSAAHYFEQDCHTPKMSKQDTTRRSKDPSIEDFETLFGEEDLSKPQLMSSLLNHENQMLQESTESPTCLKLTTTMFDAQGNAIDVEKPSKAVISPIDASAGGESRFSDEFFFHAEAPVTDSSNGKNSLVAANSPMETVGVLQRRPLLEVTKIRQSQSMPLASPMRASSIFAHPGYAIHNKMQHYQMHPFSAFHQQQLQLSQQLQQQQANSMRAFVRQSMTGGVGQKSYPQAPVGLMTPSGVEHTGQGGKFAAMQAFQRNNLPSNF